MHRLIFVLLAHFSVNLLMEKVLAGAVPGKGFPPLNVLFLSPPPATGLPL